MSETTVPVFGPEDDGLHGHLAADEWWHTETAWFSWHNAERKLGGWFYNMIRHNIGTVAGGAWVWDDGEFLPWAVQYSANFTALERPADLDFTDCELPNGVSIKVEEPTMAYRLGYDDPGRFTADLRFAAVDPPRPLASGGSTFGKAAHFDQIGHVTGSIVLHGETIEIDCWGMRDRTWGKRPENRPRQAGYVTGAGEGGNGFLAVTNTRDGNDRVAYGFVKRGEHQVDFTDGDRSVVRHPTEGYVEKITIAGTDANGDAFRAVGESVSRIFINRHTFIDINSLVRWELDDGTEWWGEDQDMWPMHTWSAAKKAGSWALS
ncbi:MAG: hypothetical protein ACI8TP_003760 [Acidimicrobiales bacterium]|jgi:hypothetical protein